jgi:hypothetical protein
VGGVAAEGKQRRLPMKWVIRMKMIQTPGTQYWLGWQRASCRRFGVR